MGVSSLLDPDPSRDPSSMHRTLLFGFHRRQVTLPPFKISSFDGPLDYCTVRLSTYCWAEPTDCKTEVRDG
jgi:hypothetical protein